MRLDPAQKFSAILRAFEQANDIHFSYRHTDGSLDIVYFKGLVSARATGRTVQYLRDLTIISLGKNGNWTRTLHTPYAKVLPVSVENMSRASRNMLEIADGTQRVPYFLLKSIGRDDANDINVPLYTYPNGESATTPEYLLFPMDYNDFLMLEQIPSDDSSISLFPLVQIFSRATEFGYSPLFYGQLLLDRALYPLFMLLVFVLLASFAWNNRIEANSYFKFAWIFAVPFMLAIAWLFCKLFLYLFKLINYYLLVSVGGLLSLAVGAVFYIFILILVSVYFLSRNSSR